MSLEAIRKSILSEAEAKAKAERGEADAEAERIVSGAHEKAKATFKQAQDEARLEGERMRREAAAGLETERNTMVIEAKGKVVEQALGRVRSEIEREIEKEDLERILKAGIKQFSEVSGGEMVVRTSKRNAALIKGKYKVEYADVDGFVLCTPDKRIALNATVDSVVDRSLDEVRKMVAGEAFTGREEKMIAKATNRAGKKRVVKAPAKKTGKRRPAHKVNARKKAAKPGKRGKRR